MGGLHSLLLAHDPSEREQPGNSSTVCTWTGETALVPLSHLVFKDVLERESLIFVIHILMSQLL